MKVYLVVSCEQYEGYSLESDEKVFLSKEKAQIYCDEKNLKFGGYYVLDYEVED